MMAEGSSCDPEVRHGGQCRPTMFTKQVSLPVDGLDPPIVAAEAKQIERKGRETWSRAPIRGLCTYRVSGMLEPLRTRSGKGPIREWAGRGMIRVSMPFTI